MKKVFGFLGAILLFVGCQHDFTPPELDFSQLFIIKEQMQQRLDECEEGEMDGQYPASSFDYLEAALDDLNFGISKARAGALILQFEVDNYVLAAQKALDDFDASIIKIVPVGTPAELYVNGIDHKGWIDFGSSTDYLGGSKFTVEFWVKNDEGFIEFSYGSLLSTFKTGTDASNRFAGWAASYNGITNSQIRFHISTDNPDFMQSLPTIVTGAPQTWGEWWHYAAVWDADNDYLGLYINGEERASMVVTDNLVPNENDPRMWAFVEPLDNSRCMAGYMKNLRLWNKALTKEEINQMMTTEVEGTEEGLLCAWDFDVKPEDDTAIPDKTGKHTAKLEGVYKWVEITE